MVNLTNTIEAKSTQLNADDLIGSPITVKITKVSGAESKEQPIAINYEGDNNKPFYPCKSMRRVLVNVWGADGAKYVGRSMTLYRDEKVRFGGIEVGGIRISHMSNIDKPVTMALTASRANKKPFTVQPLKEKKSEVSTPVEPQTDDLQKTLEAEAKKGNQALQAAWTKLTPEQRKSAVAYKEELKAMANEFDNNNGEL
jgi:hypothetical protein